MWNKLLVVACAAGLGACTVHRHYGASGQAEVYQGAEDDRGERPLDPYGPGAAEDAHDEYGAYDDRAEERSSGYGGGYAPRGWAHEARGHQCRCECNCCDRHSQLAPPARPAPVVPVVPRDPAEWLE